GYGYVDSSPDGDLPTYPQPRQTPDLFYLDFNVKTDYSDSNLDWNGLGARALLCTSHLMVNVRSFFFMSDALQLRQCSLHCSIQMRATEAFAGVLL
ncbi:MAG: hypothetical protein K9J42_11580, partial [Sulfuritalea sp.]|nr:hypothetical protein [Sulfuritalea sp.]